MRVGIDFDNTIACYDDSMHRRALQQGLIEPALPRNKRLIRDAIRSLEDGESKWRGLQVFCYGPGMPDARPMPGVKEFLAACKTRRIPVWIVSHKTEEANFGAPNVKLREAALRWLLDEGFLDSPAFGVGRDRVYFEQTRQEKIERVGVLGLTHFIDDLVETFLEKSFPPGVKQILFAAATPHQGAGAWQAFPRWSDIQRELLGP
jgi:hypothetical protein